MQIVAHVQELEEVVRLQIRSHQEQARVVDVTDASSDEADVLVATTFADPSRANGRLRGKPRLRSKRPRTSSYRISLGWLTNKVWEVTFAHAENGWDSRLRTWYERGYHDEIFQLCRDGDLDGMVRLFNTGKAKPYDVRYGGETLLEVC